MNIPQCEPPVWADSGHLQTLLGYILPSQPLPHSGQKIPIALKDGDTLQAELYSGTSQSLIILFHGLNGSTKSNYMARTAKIAMDQNHTVALVNHRDCGSGFGFAKHPYHSGRGEDVSEVISFFRKSFPKKRIVAIGFSLGANALLNLVCGQRGTDLPDFAIAVNGPIDLRLSSELLKQSWNRIYDFRFVWSCRKEIFAKAKSNRIDFNKKIPFFSHLQDIDELYTAPYAGFKNADDYYSQCSTFDHLKNIVTPTVLLMSKDDPFIPWQPYLNAQHNPHVHLHLEEYGGHLGYLTQNNLNATKKSFSYRRWLDDALNIILKENA